MGVRLGIAAVLFALLATGCAGGDKPSAAPSASPSPSSLPQAGECHRLRPGSGVDDGDAVPCTGPHNALTLAVLQLPRGVTYGTRADAFYPSVVGPCLAAYDSTVGGTAAQRNVSVFGLAYVYPTDAEKQAGARWFRCDLVAHATTRTLLDLPAQAPFVKKLLPARFAQCMNLTATVNERTYVSCTHRHRLRATGWYIAPDSLAWPGTSEINRLVKQKCQPRAKHRLFGWKTPTHDAWLRGDRLSVCFLPNQLARRR